MANRCKLGSFVEAWIAETMRTGDGRDTYMPVFLAIMMASSMKMAGCGHPRIASAGGRRFFLRGMKLKASFNGFAMKTKRMPWISAGGAIRCSPKSNFNFNKAIS